MKWRKTSQISEKRTWIMTNYEAIQKMSPEELAWFLDQVYCTGQNMGVYSTVIEDEDEALEMLDESPFDMNWLTEEAEPIFSASEEDLEDPDYMPMLDALAASILQLAGIDLGELDDLLDDDDPDDDDPEDLPF